MKTVNSILMALLLAGCASPPPAKHIADEPILRWFCQGQTKAQVRGFLNSLGFSDEYVMETIRVDGSSTITFPAPLTSINAPPED